MMVYDSDEKSSETLRWNFGDAFEMSTFVTAVNDVDRMGQRTDATRRDVQ